MWFAARLKPTMIQVDAASNKGENANTSTHSNEMDANPNLDSYII